MDEFEVSADAFVHNRGTRNFYNNLVENLLSCSEFKISVAFVSESGVQVLKETLKELEERGVHGQILTSTYLGFTKPKALEWLHSFKNVDLKIYVPPKEHGFHPKGYLFHKNPGADSQEQWTVIIGSSNLTGTALKSNVEWNVLRNEACVKPSEPGAFTKGVLEEFDDLWKSRWAKDYSDEFLISYRDYLAKLKADEKEKQKKGIFSYSEQKIVPNDMQDEAIVKLDRLRKAGGKKALAIAATGSGKTYMSVFDAIQYRPKKLLFIVHREDILHKAKESFDKICTDKDYTSGFFTGTQKDKNVKYLFASRDSLKNHYTEFSPKEFEYIVVDEAHHATSPSYKAILDYFKPEFLLGLTATPERSDSGDIYSLFDNNIAIEVRLRDALAHDLICPFHYFGITDVTGIDYSKINVDPDSSEYLEEVAKMLMVGRRVDYILEKVNFYGFDGDKAKVLGFCATVEHAKYMAQEFNKRLGAGSAVALSGEDSVPVRESYAKQLEDDNSQLQYIFTVDIFNEGIDIPSVNMVLMLRPTQSSIIFIQQLGRGLRKIADKEFVTVLDFIGNYQKSFLMAIALFGKKDFDKDSLKVAVNNNFADLPGGTYIHMDKIAKEQVLRQLESERFMAMKYMKESYYSFKQLNGGKVPFLCDYLKVDGSIDPLRFTVFNAQIKTYFEFVASVEKETHPEFSLALENPVFKSFMRFIQIFMPAKRIEEWIILQTLIGDITEQNFNNIFKNLNTAVDYENSSTLNHAARLLCGKYFDSRETEAYKEVLFYIDENKKIRVNNSIVQMLQKENEVTRIMKLWIMDAINYAIHQYQEEFGRVDYGFPFLKLYGKYSMRDCAPLCNYEKIHSSFRGQGLLTGAAPDYFIFVNLHKDADVKESINYKDKFVTPEVFHWESPNSTRQNSEVGKNLIFNQQRGIRLHLFVRKFEEIEGITQPFVYLGKVVTFSQSAKGDKPIAMDFALEHRVPDELYEDFTTVVK